MTHHLTNRVNHLAFSKITGKLLYSEFIAVNSSTIFVYLVKEKSHCWNSLHLYHTLQSFLKFGKDIVVWTMIFFKGQRLNPVTFPYQFSSFQLCFKCVTLVTSFFSQSHMLYNCFCFPSFIFFSRFGSIFLTWPVFFYYWRHFHLQSKKVNHKYSLVLEASFIMDRNILNTKLQEKSWSSSYALWFIIQIWCLILQEVGNPDVQSWNLLVQPFAQLFAY